jgi:pimeloyl-ACP methyl ester carboxylesterase
MEDYTAQVSRALDEHRLDRAVICGVSFGALVALQFAAASPQRTLALVMASPPGPAWHLRPRHRMYTRLPWIFGPLFLVETPFRLRAEMSVAIPGWRDRWDFNQRALRTFMSAPVSPAAMAARARLIEGFDRRAECGRISTPTLVITGEQHLDHVVPADGSSEYVQLIAGARKAVLERTGHAGTMTRPAAFAKMVREFVEQGRHAAA